MPSPEEDQIDRQNFMRALTGSIFSYVVNEPGLVAEAVDSVIFNPTQETTSRYWMNTSMLASNIQIVGNYDSFKILEYAGRIAAPQVFAYTLETMAEHGDANVNDRYHTFVNQGKAYLMKRLDLVEDEITPLEIARGLTGGNMDFFGNNLPWLILAGIYGVEIRENVNRFSHRDKGFSMAAVIAHAINHIPTVQERLATIFGPTEQNENVSYAVQMMDQRGRFNGAVRCPATQFVNLSCLRLAEHIMTDEFNEVTMYG